MSKKKGPVRNTLRGNNQAATLAMNILLERQLWLRRQLDQFRDIDRECGHPGEVNLVDFTKSFLRGDVAARVVEVWPVESWNDDPEIFENEGEEETEFEKAWKELEQQFQLLSMMQRVDVLSGIGRFGLLLLGINDGKALDQPAAGVNEVTGVADEAPATNKLLYTRAFSEDLIKVDSFEETITSPRYGLPKLYSVNFRQNNVTGGASATNIGVNTKVHWSRVIHVADNRTSDEVYGLPRMERVYNRLLDLKKIVGGSGEMFWKGGFPGLSLESHEGENVQIDEEATKKQMDEYQQGLQRYIALVGMKANSLAPQVADPASHVEVQLKLVATAIGVPWRVFVGSEEARLASEQDSRAWNKRVSRRRNKYCTPYIIDPTIKRLIAFGALPMPKETTKVFWPDPHTPSDKEKSEVAKAETEALAKYAQSGADLIMPPYHFLTLVMGFDQDEAEAILKAAVERVEETQEMDEENADAAADRDIRVRRATGNGE